MEEKLAYLEKECEDHCARLRSLAFLERVAYMSDGTPYNVIVGENPEFRWMYEAYRDLFNYVKALNKAKQDDTSEIKQKG